MVQRVDAQNAKITSVLVAGDIVLDRHIYEGERATLQDHSPRGTSLIEEPGGAAATQRLIEAVFDAELKDRVMDMSENVNSASRPLGARVCRLACKVPKEIQGPWPERLVGYSWWGPHSRPGTKDQFWRVSKSFGYGWVSSSDLDDARTGAASVLQAVDNLPADPEILVLDDAGDDFRRKENRALWHVPDGEGSGSVTPPRWIILKLAGPIGQGDLWDRLMGCDQQNLIVLMSAQLLRQANIRLSRGLSWERTAEHLTAALRQNHEIEPLRKAGHLIVHFEGDGAAWIDFTNEEPTVRLVFDPEHAEGEWGRRIKGEVFGHTSCLAAAVVQILAAITKPGAKPNLQAAIERALSAMRTLREEGHGIAIPDKGVLQRGQGFPVARLAREILQPGHRFASAEVPWKPSDSTGQPWSILGKLQNKEAPTTQLFGFARQLVVRGDAVLTHVPQLRVGDLLVVGRDEMESIRSLRRILEAYRDTASGKKPLSIGVFGAPGSGKSFGVKQLAIGVFGEPDKKSYDGWMEFNLSQFDTPADLIGAFHQVRDRVLQGLTPVVFWDEFDSRRHYWLQYLLAPMQDGRFQAGQITHTLGKCVFIFAGGTAESFAEFKAQPNGVAEFKLAKGPDFKSRLDGYLNVLGPNQRSLPVEGSEERKKDAPDIFFPVRRAVIIRHVLGCKRQEKLEIDPGLVTALLEIDKYENGARSLEKALEPYIAERKKSRAPLRRSSLPAPEQLSLHVNAKEFHELCARDLPFKADEVTRKLAPAIHEKWREIARSEGWKPRYDMPYDQLPPDIKRANEAAARRIPDILAVVGLRVEPGAATPQETDLIQKHLEHHIEALAEEEHDGWMAQLEAEGWHFDKKRDDDKRVHDCLLPFHQLSDANKEKDRNSVRHFPDFARDGGFKIVFI